MVTVKIVTSAEQLSPAKQPVIKCVRSPLQWQQRFLSERAAITATSRRHRSLFRPQAPLAGATCLVTLGCEL